MFLPEDILPLDPISDFVIVMFMILLLPKLFEKIKLPYILGLLCGGCILGPRILGILTPEEGVMNFLADVGKLMVMFFAGLEIDFEKFLKAWKKSAIFGMMTFLIPLLGGLTLGLLFNFHFLSSLLIGSLLASHTLISIPILMKYKIIKKEAIAVTVGATIFTDIAALIVLSICVSLFTVGLSWSILAVRFIGLVIYLPLVLFGAKWLTKKYFSWIAKDENNKTIMMLFIMTLAAAGAEIIHLEGIVGAFVGGLAVNEIIHKGPVKRNLETLGNTLFIPMFFLVIGSLIDTTSFMRMQARDYLFVGLIVLLLISAKYAAAKLASIILKYKSADTNMMWALSIPQVAATLAAALVAYQTKNADGERLISVTVFDSVLVLMAITTILGPILTQRFAKAMQK